MRTGSRPAMKSRQEKKNLHRAHLPFGIGKRPHYARASLTVALLEQVIGGFVVFKERHETLDGKLIVSFRRYLSTGKELRNFQHQKPS